MLTLDVPRVLPKPFPQIVTNAPLSSCPLWLGPLVRSEKNSASPAIELGLPPLPASPALPLPPAPRSPRRRAPPCAARTAAPRTPGAATHAAARRATAPGRAAARHSGCPGARRRFVAAATTAQAQRIDRENPDECSE